MYLSTYIWKLHKQYIENPDKYFKENGVWTNWYEFLGLDTTKFIQTKKEWIKFCKEKNAKNVDDYKKLCKEYGDILPQNPSDFYKGFTNIKNELGLARR